ncbi:MAG: zinc ribbon domain-containing protein [Clostridia bacterium]|nr:zinc ribbon domain-containing protein [Clostridia bacterium]
MKCNKCGNELNENDLFCGKCGNKIVQNTVNTNKSEGNKKSKNKTIIKIIVVILSILIICAIFFAVINIYNVKSENRMYLDVLEGKEKFITYNTNNNKNTKSYTLDEWIDEAFALYALEIHYCFLDIDNDNSNEMYVEIELPNLNDTAIIVLNKENGKIYGFEYPTRGMINLKTDGTYMTSGGMDSQSINKVVFKGTEMVETHIALQDGNSYIVNNKSVTQQEYNAVVEEFNNKQNIKLVEYEIKNNISKDSFSSEKTQDDIDTVTTSKVTTEKYNKIQNGMTYSKVCGIMGFLGELSSELGTDQNGKTKTYLWTDNNFNTIRVTFLGNKVIGKNK